MSAPPLRIGTRGSDLALAQTRAVIDALRGAHPTRTFEHVVIRSEADDAPDAPIGSPDFPAGGFTGTIERALLAGDIDLAVHSCKDLSAADPDGLIIAATPSRAPVHDMLVWRTGEDLNVARGFRVGTGSPRRTAQLRAYLAGAQPTPIRGNVPTRLRKVVEREVDAVALAAAGLLRLGLLDGGVVRIGDDRLQAIPLELDWFVPCACQGAIAVQARAGSEPAALAQAIDDAPTRRAVDAERRALRALNATCDTPIGVLAQGDEVIAQLFTPDGCRSERGPIDDAEAIARRLAQTR